MQSEWELVFKNLSAFVHLCLVVFIVGVLFGIGYCGYVAITTLIL